MWRFLRDPAAPKLPRLMAVLAVLYLVIPIDVITDALPVIGWLDDLGVMGAVLAYVASQAARYENRQHGAPPATGTP